MVSYLDGRNRARVIAEALARVIAALWIASVRWRSYLTEFWPRRPCVRCIAIRIARLAFVGVVFVPRGLAEWPARVNRVRWTLAIGDWRFCPSKVSWHHPVLLSLGLFERKRRKTLKTPRIFPLANPKNLGESAENIQKDQGSCSPCLRLLVLEPRTDHAESCEIMADHAKSCPWKCLKVPDFA